MSGLSANYRLNKLIKTLNEVHQTEINFDVDDSALIDALNEYTKIKSEIVRESAFNNQVFDPEYTKAVIVCEAIKIFLREIAPNRKRKKRK